MAQRVKVELVDDIDGGEADETIEFLVNGIAYQIDLSESNATSFYDAVAVYVEHARRLHGRQKSATRRPTAQKPVKVESSSATVRAWAATQPDIELKDRGRVPQWVIDRFEAAH